MSELSITITPTSKAGTWKVERGEDEYTIWYNFEEKRFYCTCTYCRMHISEEYPKPCTLVMKVIEYLVRKNHHGSN